MNKKEHQYKALFPLGEVVDKVTILLIKTEKFHNIETKELAKIGLECFFGYLVDVLDRKFLLKDFSLLIDCFCKLLENNIKQWNAENRVRGEQSAEAATEARELNSIRVGLKNQLNAVFSEYIELKEYPHLAKSKTNKPLE